MKLKIKELNKNPFKKEINRGKLNEVQIEEISGNLEELGYMGAIPIVKIKNKYHLVNSHHRVEALKRKFGKDYELAVTVHNYNDDQLLRGMVIENLAQRGSDFKEEIENIRTVEEYLNKNKKILSNLRDSRKLNSNFLKGGAYKNGATARDIQGWLKLSKEKWSDDIILQIMNIYKKLDKSLLEKTNYVRGGKKDSKEHLSVEDARNLSRVDIKEQKKMKEILDETELNHKGKSKLISAYKNADEETKKKVINKQIDIRDIDYENKKSEYLKENDFRGLQKQTVSDWIVELSDNIKRTGELMNISKLDQCNKTQLDLLYRYIKVDFDKYYSPFLKKLLEQTQGVEVKRLR